MLNRNVHFFHKCEFKNQSQTLDEQFIQYTIRIFNIFNCLFITFTIAYGPETNILVELITDICVVLIHLFTI